MSRLTPKPEQIEVHLGLLAQTIPQIAASIQGRQPADLIRSPGPRQWSVLEVLAHLRGCADLWTYSIYAMLAEDDPQLPLLDERRWARAACYAALDFSSSFQGFSQQRAELLNVLRTLPQPSWSRTAQIGGRSHSVFSQARRMALHEAEHCRQVEEILDS